HPHDRGNRLSQHRVHHRLHVEVFTRRTGGRLAREAQEEGVAETGGKTEGGTDDRRLNSTDRRWTNRTFSRLENPAGEENTDDHDREDKDEGPGQFYLVNDRCQHRYDDDLQV